MASRSDQELDNYLVNPHKFTPEAITAAIAELELRGRKFSENELTPVNEVIKQKLEKRAEEEKREVVSLGKQYEVNAEGPEYYSNRAIYFFSIFFSVIFGAILLAVNIWDNKSARWNVIGFGILYTAAAVSVMSQFEITSVWSVVINAIGGSILTTFFWNKYLGRTVKYKSKPIWKPLLISVLISIPFAAAMIYTMSSNPV